MKLYAKQIPPEQQESPLSYGPEMWPDDLILDGNLRFKSHTTAEYDHLVRYLDEMAGEWQNARFFYRWNPETRRFDEYKKSRPEINGEPYSLRELLRDYGFNRPDGKQWTTRQRHEWREILEAEEIDEDKAFLHALSLMTGKEWAQTIIRGCCQSDWQSVVYPVEDWTQESLDHFEAEYFNTGSEWMVHDEDYEPEDVNDISGYCVYCYGWSSDQIRAEIASAAGRNPEDVVLYEYTGRHYTPEYEIA